MTVNTRREAVKMLSNQQKQLLTKGRVLGAKIPGVFGDPAWVFVEPKPAAKAALHDAFWGIPPNLTGLAFTVTECEMAEPSNFKSPAYFDCTWYRSGTVFGFDEVERYLRELGYNPADLVDETNLNHPF